jgi:hypothetical protein
MPTKDQIDRAVKQLQAELTANADAIGSVLEHEDGTCEALARRGTGTGMCNRPLDERGQCDRASDHI